MPRIYTTLRDSIGGLKVPLAEGFYPSHDRVFIASKAGSLFTAYGGARAGGDPTRLVRGLIEHASRNLSRSGFRAAGPRVSRSGSWIQAQFTLEGGRGILLKLTVDRGLVKYYTLLEGEEDPVVMEDLALSVEEWRVEESRRVEIHDPARGMVAATITVPTRCGVQGGLTRTLDVWAEIDCGDLSIRVEPSRFIYAQGYMSSLIAQQMASMGFRVSAYMDARTYASQLGGWDHVVDVWPPPILSASTAEAIVYGMQGLWSGISSVIAYREGEALWASTIGIQTPMEGELLVFWTGHTALARGRDSLNTLLNIMAYSRIEHSWAVRVAREMARMSRALSRAGPSYTPSYTPSYSPPPYTAGTDYTGSEYSYDSMYDDDDYGWDDPGGYSGGPPMGGYEDYDDGYDPWDEEERRRGLAKYRDTPDAQFYVDDEGRVRVYDYDEEIAAQYIDEDGYLRDEEHRIVGRVEQGYIYDERTGERVGVFNVESSDEYWIRELEENMKNPREQLGLDMFGPDETEKRDIDPSWVWRKRKDRD